MYEEQLFKKIKVIDSSSNTPSTITLNSSRNEKDKNNFTFCCTSYELLGTTAKISDYNIPALSISNSAATLLNKISTYKGTLKKSRKGNYFIKIDNLQPFNIKDHIDMILKLTGYHLALDITEKQYCAKVIYMN
jgi:hypothetical protein